MNNQTETYFVSTFVSKPHRERLLHELTSEKKRTGGLDRFSHQAEELLDSERVAMKDGDLENFPDFRDFVMAHNETCELLSPDPVIDGKSLPFAEAVTVAAFSPDAVIIVGRGFCAVFSEAEKNGRVKYLLTEDHK